MANKALTMLQVRRILKLLMEESSQREIHRSTGIHRPHPQKLSASVQEQREDVFRAVCAL